MSPVELIARLCLKLMFDAAPQVGFGCHERFEMNGENGNGSDPQREGVTAVGRAKLLLVEKSRLATAAGDNVEGQSDRCKNKKEDAKEIHDR